MPLSTLAARLARLAQQMGPEDVEVIAKEAGAPVVEEPHPTYTNLIGKIERKAQLGVMFTDFTEIKAGAFLQASGGYLILNAMDLLRQPFAWEALKRELKEQGVSDCCRTKVGCLRICAHGPTALVYPDGTWYHGMTPERVPQLVERLLVKNGILGPHVWPADETQLKQLAKGIEMVYAEFLEACGGTKALEAISVLELEFTQVDPLGAYSSHVQSILVRPHMSLERGMLAVVAVAAEDSTRQVVGTVNAESRYELSLPKGAWWVRAWRDLDRNRAWQRETEPASPARRVEVEPAAEVLDVDLVLERGSGGP